MVHVGKKHVIGISCLYPCLLYFVVPTLNFKHVFSWLRSSQCGKRKWRGRNLGTRPCTREKAREEASLLPCTPFTLLTHPKCPFPSHPRSDTEQSPESLTVLRKSRDVCDLIDHPQEVIGSCVIIQIFHQSDFRIPNHLESKLINWSNCPKVLKSVFQFTVLLYFESLSKTTEVPKPCGFKFWISLSCLRRIVLA